MTLSVRRLVLRFASITDLIACAVTVFWVASGFFWGIPFAISFAIGSATFFVASLRQGRAPIIVAVVFTVIGEYEPAGGIVASTLLRQNVGVGAAVPLIAGLLGIVAGLVVLYRHRPGQRA
jgi:hypothetical protein